MNKSIYKSVSVVVMCAALLCGSVLADIPALQRETGKNMTRVSAHINKIWPVKLGKPVKALSLDAVMNSGHMSVIVNDAQFGELLFQTYTRTRLNGELVTPDKIPDGEKMVVWGKWDRHDPTVFKALAVSCRERLSDMAVRQKIALACQNISSRRTVTAVPEPEERVITMTAPPAAVAVPEMSFAAVPVAPEAPPRAVASATSSKPVDISMVITR